MASQPLADDFPPAPAALVETVARNCLIADARHARDMTMCSYLLAMRERYRLEAGLPLGGEVPRKPLGEWLEARERLWDSLEDADYAPLPLEGGAIDPFDCDAANAALGGQGLFYSAGLGRGARPHFCLAVLERRLEAPGHRVLVAGAEYAGDLVGPPAALRGETIYLRERALRRWLWTRIEEWRWRRSNQALGRALAAYGLTGDEADADAALDAMMRAEGEAVLLHEQGELRAAALLGPAWEEMLAALDEPRSELVLRAVRDHLADCLVTLPELLAREAQASLHFYAGNLYGMRRELFPAWLQAYEAWVETGSTASLAAVVEAGRKHWLAQAQRLLALHAAQDDDDAGGSIAARVQDATLRL
jgi:hypothetical protein